jgi:hypothetical protein
MLIEGGKADNVGAGSRQ